MTAKKTAAKKTTAPPASTGPVPEDQGAEGAVGGTLTDDGGRPVTDDGGRPLTHDTPPPAQLEQASSDD